MIPASTLDKPIWRMALHNALSNNIISIDGWLWGCSRKPFSISDIQEVVGISESEYSYPDKTGSKSEYLLFRTLVHLKDGRYCSLEARQSKTNGWLHNGSAIFSKSLRKLMLHLETSHAEALKLHHLL